MSSSNPRSQKEMGLKNVVSGFLLAVFLSASFQTFAQEDEIVRAEVAVSPHQDRRETASESLLSQDHCIEQFISSDLKDDCDPDIDPNDLDDDELHEWWVDCTCSNRGHAEVMACCVLDEFVKRGHEVALRGPGFLCPLPSGSSIAECSTFSRAIENFNPVSL